MSQIVVRKEETQISKIENVLINGDLARLEPAERVSYYKNVCESMGLNPLTKPFDYITLNGKLTLYARKDATEQLRKIHGVSIIELTKERFEDVYVVTAKAKDASGREDTATGAVNLAGLKGEALANAFMKAETKSKRRVTLSICGLGMLDETEVEDISEDRSTARIVPDQPGARDGFPSIQYKVPFGKYKDYTLEEIETNEPGALKKYIAYLERTAEEKNKPIVGAAKMFIERAENFLGALENGTLEPDSNE
jgi:hypothetical protein